MSGALTVEMAMIMPLMLLVIFFLISIGFYEHDKAVLTEQSLIMARNDSMYEEDMNMDDNIRAMCITSEEIDIWTEETIVKSTVISEGLVRMLLSGNKLKINSRQSYVKNYAPDLIRLINVGRSIKETIIDRK